MGRKLLGIAVLLSIVLAVFVAGEPAPPVSITPGASFRANFSSSGNAVAAEAGNTTQLIISGVSVTESWQGYYGNVSGFITLDDANNNSLYRWTTFSSTGEVYASNNSNVNWSAVQCVNFTDHGNLRVNVSTLEAQFNINDGDVDGFNETFNATFDGSFFVGTIKINDTDQCHSTNLFNATGAQTEHFEEVLLTDTSSRGIIFTAITENNVPGFDGAIWDFEMLVAEDGHSGDTSTTDYYFFVEMV